MQLQSTENAEALLLLLNVDHVSVILQKHIELGEALFVKLHAWAVQLLKDNVSLNVVEKYLGACQAYAQPSQLATLHHTWACAALADGNVELSLEHIDPLLQILDQDHIIQDMTADRKSVV